MVNITSVPTSVCVCWVLGCSLHSHAGGGRYQDAGVEQRRETRAFLHAGHPDLKEGKSKISYSAKVYHNFTAEMMKTLDKTCFN